MAVSIQCPLCKMHCVNIIGHMRFGHSSTMDDMIELMYKSLQELDHRITSLTELLEIREK